MWSTGSHDVASRTPRHERPEQIRSNALNDDQGIRGSACSDVARIPCSFPGDGPIHDGGDAELPAFVHRQIRQSPQIEIAVHSESEAAYNRPKACVTLTPLWRAYHAPINPAWRWQ